MASGTMSGSGTLGDPYLVEDALDLKAIESYGYDKYYEQTQDITLGVFEPIGYGTTTTKTDFTGDYDGAGFSIKNGSITVTSGNYHNGIFAYLSGAVVKNIVIDNVDVICSINGGIVCGTMVISSQVLDITIKNSSLIIIGSPTNIANIGLITGYCADSIIDGVTVESTSIYTEKLRVGGIVGDLDGASTVRNCTLDALCSITGATAIAQSIGGIAGYQHNVSALVEKCLNEADISSPLGVDMGGIVGFSLSGTISNCHNKGELTGNTEVGGILGYVSGSSVAVRYCLNEGNINATALAGGILGGTGASGSIQYNYALNTSITRTSGVLVTFGRISGTTTGTYTSNYALDTMTMNT